jgi:hypothetical protein
LWHIDVFEVCLRYELSAKASSFSTVRQQWPQQQQQQVGHTAETQLPRRNFSEVYCDPYGIIDRKLFDMDKANKQRSS